MIYTNQACRHYKSIQLAHSLFTFKILACSELMVITYHIYKPIKMIEHKEER
jgi:hypothetical protein